MRIPILILLLSACTAAIPAGAVEDGLAFAVDPAEGVVYNVATTSTFEQVQVQLCIFTPSRGGVSGWECAVEVDGSPVAPTWQVTAGLDVAFDEELFQVGIGVGAPALRPGPGDAVAIATWTAFITDTESEVSFYIKAYPGSVTFDGVPGYVGPDDATDTQDLVTPGGGNFADFTINGSGDGPFQDRTWGEVKVLYR